MLGNSVNKPLDPLGQHGCEKLRSVVFGGLNRQNLKVVSRAGLPSEHITRPMKTRHLNVRIFGLFHRGKIKNKKVPSCRIPVVAFVIYEVRTCVYRREHSSSSPIEYFMHACDVKVSSNFSIREVQGVMYSIV